VTVINMDPWQESSAFQKSPRMTVNCLDNNFVKPNSQYVVEGKGAKHNGSNDEMPHPTEKGGLPPG